MSAALRVVAIAGGAWTAFVGGWGVVNHRTLSTRELQEMSLWIGLALIAAGVGLVALGLGSMRAPGAR